MTGHFSSLVQALSITSGTGTAHPSGAHEFRPIFSGVHATRSLVLYVCFVDRCLSFYLFSFGHCVVCPLRILIIPLVFKTSSYK